MTEPQDPYAGQPYGGYPPPQQPQQPYGPPPYGQQYPQYQGYPQQYPQHHPQAYPQPYPQQLGYPYGYPAPRRPGLVTAAAVLAFVAAGLLIIAAIVLFVSADVLRGADDSGFENGGTSAEAAVDGVLNLLAAGLLIAGGVQCAARRPPGRRLLLIGAAITAACSVYWVVRPADHSDTLFWALAFAALVVLAGIFVSTADTRAWLAGSGAPTRAP